MSLPATASQESNTDLKSASQEGALVMDNYQERPPLTPITSGNSRGGDIAQRDVEEPVVNTGRKEITWFTSILFGVTILVCSLGTGLALRWLIH